MNARTTNEEHPVLVREVVRRDGSRGLALRVFCSRRAESVPLETCAACPSCLVIATEPDGVSAVVRCKPPEGAAARRMAAPSRSDAPGDITPVGTVLRGGTLCVG